MKRLLNLSYQTRLHKRTTPQNLSLMMASRLLVAGYGLILAMLATPPAQATPHSHTKDHDLESHLATLRRQNQNLVTFTLENGVQCLIKPDASAPVATVQFWIASGSMHETPFLGSGIAHAVEHMIFKGTPTRPPGAITREINDVGGQVNAYTTLDRTVYYADVPSEHWETAFDVLFDGVVNASFPPEEWEQEREVILREIAMDEDNPERVINKNLWQTVMRHDTRRHPVIGYTDVFQTLSRDDLVTWHRQHYTPDNTMVVVVGDIEVDNVISTIKGNMERFPRRPRGTVILPDEPRQLTARYLRTEGHVTMGRVALAWPTVSLHHPDAAALSLLSTIAGQGRSSRMHRTLVEEKQILDRLSVWSYTPDRKGLFGLSGLFNAEDEDKVIKTLNEEIESLRNSDYTREEIDRAIRMALTSQLRRFETMRGQASIYGVNQLYTGDPRFMEHSLSRLMEVTAEDLNYVSRTYLVPERMSTVVKLPFSDTDTTPVDKSHHPRFSYPEPERRILDNGITLLTHATDRLPFVYIATTLKGGLRAEPESRRGMTMLMANLLLRGTPNRSRESIDMTVESRGASLNAYAGNNTFGIEAGFIRDDLPLMIELLADCLLHPLFEDGAIERQRQLQITAIRQQGENPMAIAQQHMRHHIFPRHPYRDTPEGRIKTVKHLTRDDLVEHHQRLVVASNLVVSVFGDIDADVVENEINRAFKSMSTAPVPRFEHDIDTTNPIRVTKGTPHQQTIVLAAFPGLTLNDPMLDALDVLQTAMSGLSSELALEIRDRRGLAYFSGARHQPGLEPGVFIMFAGTRQDAVEKIEHLFEAERKRIVRNGLTENELNRAKAELSASVRMQLQNTLNMARHCALNERYGLGANALFQRPERIAAVTNEDIRAVAARVLDTERRVVIIIEPETKQPLRDET